jgi:uncharacterized membrane protein
MATGHGEQDDRTASESSDSRGTEEGQASVQSEAGPAAAAQADVAVAAQPDEVPSPALAQQQPPAPEPEPESPEAAGESGEPPRAGVAAERSDGSAEFSVSSEPREQRPAIIARALTWAALIGFAVVLAGQFAPRPDWLTDLLRDNDVEMHKRMLLICSAGAGAVSAVLLSIAALVIAARKGVPLARVEQVLRLLSPLVLLPALPLMLQHQAWRNRHESLLPVVLLVALALEALLYQSLLVVPARLRSGWQALCAALPRWWGRYGPLAVVLAGALFYSSFMSFFALRWHWRLETHVFDLGINNNLLYGGLKGVFMHSPLVSPADPAAYLATHAKYGCYLFLPIYALYPKAETLIFLQSTLLGCGAIPLFGFARRHISPWLAAALALAYLCYYPMHGANFYEVKWVPVASFFVLAMIWAADARRWVWCAIAFVTALLLREDMPIGLAVVGGFLLLTGHRPRAGLIIALVSGLWFVIIKFVVMEQAGDWWFPKMYKALWAPGEGGYGSVIKTLLSNQLFVFDKLLEQRKVFYVMHLLVPIVFLPARRWYLWAAFVPGVILTLLATDYKPPTMFSFQYVMYWTPYVFPAAALALAAIQRESVAGRARSRAALAALLLASGVLTYNYGAFPARDGSLEGGYSKITFSFSETERQRYDNLRELMRLIPAHASVAATERTGAHLSSRLHIYSMRKGPHGAEYIVAWSKQLGLARTRPTLREAVRSGEYGVLERRGDLVLLKRGHDTSGNRQLLRDWNL